MSTAQTPQPPLPSPSPTAAASQSPPRSPDTTGTATPTSSKPGFFGWLRNGVAEGLTAVADFVATAEKDVEKLETEAPVIEGVIKEAEAVVAVAVKFDPELSVAAPILASAEATAEKLVSAEPPATT